MPVPPFALTSSKGVRYLIMVWMRHPCLNVSVGKNGSTDENQ